MPAPALRRVPPACGTGRPVLALLLVNMHRLEADVHRGVRHGRRLTAPKRIRDARVTGALYVWALSLRIGNRRAHIEASRHHRRTSVAHGTGLAGRAGRCSGDGATAGVGGRGGAGSVRRSIEDQAAVPSIPGRCRLAPRPSRISHDASPGRLRSPGALRRLERAEEFDHAVRLRAHLIDQLFGVVYVA